MLHISESMAEVLAELDDEEAEKLVLAIAASQSRHPCQIRPVRTKKRRVA